MIKATAHRDILRQIKDRIVSQFHPEKIILFGSHARGEARPDSDLDLLVVLPIKGSRSKQIGEIGASLQDFPHPIDILVSTPEEFAWRKEVAGTIEHPASREGKYLYGRP